MLADRKVGQLSSYAAFQNKHYGLAVLRKTAWETGTVLVVGEQKAQTL